MTIADAENAMRVRASQWATANGLDFVFDNGIGLDPTVQPSDPTLIWSFRPRERQRMTAGVVEHRGSCIGTILMSALPLGGTSSNPVSDRIVMAQSLKDYFRGQTLGGALILDQTAVKTVTVAPPMAGIEVDVAWHYCEEADARGYQLSEDGEGSEAAYNAWRAIWSGLSLNVTTYFDGIPPGLALSLPAAVCSFTVSQGIPLDMHTTMHTGAINCGLHYPLETGVQSSQQDVEDITKAFDSVSVGKVSFGSPQTAIIGRTAGETWQVNVRMPFVFQDIFPS